MTLGACLFKYCTNITFLHSNMLTFYLMFYDLMEINTSSVTVVDKRLTCPNVPSGYQANSNRNESHYVYMSVCIGL